MPFGRGRYSRGSPPNAPGMYRYVNKDTGKVDYVGQAVDIRKRYNEHLRGDAPPLDTGTHHFEWKKQS